MYNRLKKMIAILTLLAIGVVGIFFLDHFQNEIFGGENQVIFVENSNIQIESDLKTIAQESHSVIAKRVLDVDQEGNLRNTFYPIGATELPAHLPIQNNQRLIDNSPNNTIYVIVSGALTAEKLVEKLTSLGNVATIFRTNHAFVLIKNIAYIPQILIVLVVILFSFASLILAEYISEIRTAGIRRLAGERKYSIALKQTGRDSLFLVFTTVILLCGLVIALGVKGFLSISCFTIIATPMLIWLLLLLAVNLFLSNVFYLILQKQPIHLSIKGKAPAKTIYCMAIFMQLFALVSLLYSLESAGQMEERIARLNTGMAQWEKQREFYQVTEIDDGGTVERATKRQFYQELYRLTDMLMITDNLNQIECSTSPSKGGYHFSAEGDANVLYVSQNFIEKSQIEVAPELLEQIAHLGKYENIILIPATQKGNYPALSQKWEEMIYREALSAAEDNAESDAAIKVVSGEYRNGDAIFVYPIFDLSIQTNESFAQNPIIIVGTPYSNSGMYPNGWNVRISDRQTLAKLITNYQLEHTIGSLTNGYYSIHNRIQLTRQKANVLMMSCLVSVIVSVLLIILVNTIYFYQGRKVFFIERLAGKSLFSIHKNYLLTVILANLFLFMLLFVTRLFADLYWVVLIYLLSIIVIFILQLMKTKRTNVLYLKGE